MIMKNKRGIGAHARVPLGSRKLGKNRDQDKIDSLQGAEALPMNLRRTITTQPTSQLIVLVQP
jgi:hypothetical protein